MLSVSSIYNLLTTFPSGPVWGVTNFFPNKNFASFFNSSAPVTIFIPPALPLPPAWIWAFKTIFFVFSFLNLCSRSFSEN